MQNVCIPAAFEGSLLSNWINLVHLLSKLLEVREERESEMYIYCLSSIEPIPIIVPIAVRDQL